MRHTFIVAASILIGCFLIGIAASPSSIGQANPVSAPPGRYQVAVQSRELPTVILCDTTTGECWAHVFGSNKGWSSITPAVQR
jgi:hypothetical protein